uniref:Transcription factor CBF/NF-Y/archaeal histone domain-containing protein n=1 Tax=Setaria digitata TaxID=48799 RepID=A0A915PXT3_9BILA
MEDPANVSTSVIRTQLPVARVKKICRLDPSCNMISAQAVQLLTLATEHFIGLLAKVAYSQAVFDKRKTLQLKDLEFCIKNYEPFNFLDGTLDGWPEISSAKHRVTSLPDTNLTVNMSTEEALSADADAGDGEEQEDLNIHGLSDEIFGFDELLEEDISALSATDDPVLEKLDNFITAENEKMDEDNISVTQPLKTEIFGHYGYYPSAISTNAEAAEIELIDQKIQMEEEMEVVEVIDISTRDDLLNRSGFELATDAAKIMSDSQSFNQATS